LTRPTLDIGHETAVIRAKSPHWMVGFKRVMDFSFSMLEQSHGDLLAICQGADLIIVSHSAAGSMEADKLGLPTVSVTLFPQAIPVKDPKDSFVKRAIMNIAGAGMGKDHPHAAAQGDDIRLWVEDILPIEKNAP
jgi:hypothetical protein